MNARPQIPDDIEEYRDYRWCREDARRVEGANGARARGVKIIGATLTPFWGAAYYTDIGETKRRR